MFIVHKPPNGFELSCPAEAGRPPSLYATPVGQASDSFGPARRVSFSEWLGSVDLAPLGHMSADRGLLLGEPSASHWPSAITLWPGSCGVRKGGGRPAADNRWSLVDQSVIREGLHHEEGIVHSARKVALKDGVAHVTPPYG